jgi:hypothetical protein
MTDINEDPARGEADLIDFRVEQLANRQGISKYAAYQELLSSPEGLRLLADLKMVQKRYDEEDELRSAAQSLEEAQNLWPKGRHGPV